MTLQRVATVIHSAGTTETLFAVLQDVLIGSGFSGAYTILFTARKGALAEVYRSTYDGMLPGTTLMVQSHIPLACLQQTPTYFETLQPIVDGEPAIKVAVLAPLRADDKTYGVLLLHEVVPEQVRRLIACTAEQFGLALWRMQFQEELQRRHSIDAAKLGAVAETSKVLREFDLDIVLAKLMDLALSSVAAEVGCIVLQEADAAALTCRIEWGLDGVAVQQLRFKDGEPLAERLIREKVPVIIRQLGVEQPFLPAPVLEGIHSLVALPLITHTRALGGLVLVNLGVSNPQDLELLQTIVDLSNMAIENALLHQEALEKEALREQLRIAGDIQRALLPKVAPMIQGVRLSAWSMPCDEAGGDYYDVFQLDEHRLGFVVGDATGHGIGAALMATTVRALLRALVRSTEDPSQLFGQLNDLAATDFPEGKFVTLFYGIYNTRDRILTYVSAGHRPPLIIYRQAQDAFEHLVATGIPLGIFAGALYEQKTTAPLEDEDVNEAPAGPCTRLTPALARGLSYYTGPIFEIVSDDFSGSLGGGGRYDNLVGMFSGKQVPAVGFSLGLERILLLMEEQQMFPDLQMAARVMICPLPDTPMAPVVGLAVRLRQAGITVELYAEQGRLGRQLSAADALHIPYALIIGPEEINQRAYTLKRLATGDQYTYDEAGLVEALQRL